MRLLSNAKVILKVALPLVILSILTAGLGLYSRATLGDLAAQTQQIVDVQATRLESVLNVRINVNEASIQARNILIETRETEMAQYKSRYDAAIKSAFENVDRLIAMSDTAERKAVNQTLRDTMTEFFAIMDRANLHGMKNDNETASKILLTEATVGLAKVRAITQPRIDRPTAELRQARDDAEQAVSRASTLLVATAAFGLLGALTLASLIVVFGLTRPMGSLVAVLQRMAKGDTEAEIVEARHGDEIGAVGKAVEGIKAMVAQKTAGQAEIKRGGHQQHRRRGAGLRGDGGCGDAGPGRRLRAVAPIRAPRRRGRALPRHRAGCLWRA